MTKILLPAIINAPTFKKDRSCSIKFDTRELDPQDAMTILALNQSEGWLCFSPNQEDIQIPEEQAETDEKSPSERLRNVLYVWYSQEVESGKYVGIFENFRREKMEKIIETIKGKLK